MSCEDCKYAPTTYEEYCLSRHNYSGYFCPDSYTEISHLCGNYGEDESEVEK